MTARERIAAQRGAALIEVIVSGVLLAVLAIGLFPLYDVSASKGAAARTRAVATSIAGDTIERMRAMPVTTLAFYSSQTTSTVRGIRYTINARADWMRDSTGDVNCTLNTTGVEYLRLRATVSSKGLGNTPVQIDSIVTPPTGAFDPSAGTLVVYTRDAAGRPLSGVTVAGGGRSGISGPDGCVVLILLAGNTTSITAQSQGLVTTDGDAIADVPVTIVPGKTASVSVQLDRPATANVNFDTVARAGQAATPAPVAASSAASPPLAGPVVKPLSPSVSSTSMTLFPFPDGYGVYAGDCEGNDPTRFGLAANLISPTPGSTVAKTVRVPSAWVRTQRSGGTGFQASAVVLRPDLNDNRMSGCTGRFTLNANASGDAIGPLPIGAYTVCAADSSSRVATGTLLNATPNGSAAPQLTLTVPSSGSNRPGCP